MRKIATFALLMTSLLLSGQAQELKPITEDDFRINMFYLYMNNNGAIAYYVDFDNNCTDDTLMEVTLIFKVLSPKSDLKKGKYVYAPLYSYRMGRRRVQDDEGRIYVYTYNQPLGRDVREHISSEIFTWEVDKDNIIGSVLTEVIPVYKKRDRVDIKWKPKTSRLRTYKDYDVVEK